MGQNLHWWNGAISALSAGMPPTAVAGKNLKCLRPMARPRMISPAVATPGRNGVPDLIAACPSPSVRPGETMNSAPAPKAASSYVVSVTVPAPTIAPLTTFMRLITSSAALVRSVTSRILSPPSTSAEAISRASCSSSITSTEITDAAQGPSSGRTPGEQAETGNNGVASDRDDHGKSKITASRIRHRPIKQWYHRAAKDRNIDDA